jgi:hypothetical protein
MKNIQELKQFCNDYLQSLSGDLSEIDDWIQWGGYDINIFGQEWGIRIQGDKNALSVDAYPANWQNTTPDAIHSFDIGRGQQ